MGIDPAIVLGIRQPQIKLDDPLESYAKVLGLKNAMSQGELQTMKLQEAKQGLESDQRLRALLSENPNATPQQLMGINPKLGMDYAKNRSELEKNQAAIAKDNSITGKNELDQTMKKVEHMSAMLHAARQNPDMWPSIRTLAATQYPGIQLPQQFDPNFIDAKIAEGQTITQRLAAQQQAATAAEQQRHNRATEANTVRGQDLGATGTRYEQTEAGLVAVPNRLAPGQAPVATPVLGATGAPLGKPLKDIPPAVNTKIIENRQNLTKAETALALNEGKSVGSGLGDTAATGWKGFLPNQVLNRVDPQGVDARAAIADLGSMIIHDRSGAAVTAAEFPRLAPFIPSEKDDAATVQKKLRRFVEIYKQETQALSDTYSREAGFKESKVLGSKAPKIGDRMDGYIFKGGDPGKQESWERERTR